MTNSLKNNKALLIIDMQKGSFLPSTPQFDSEGVVKRINHISKIFRNHKYTVIVIQHDGSIFDKYVPNTPDWKLLDDLEVNSSDIFLNKTANDAFYNTSLDTTLRALSIDELYITGCATDFCVSSTIQSALIKDYNIIVVEDAHTAGDRPHSKAKKLIAHYNWVWKNMMPTNGKILVKNTEQVEEMV